MKITRRRLGRFFAWSHRGWMSGRALLALLAALIPLPAFCAAGVAADYGGYRPHYQGFGVKTPGGRGGQILRVTNLHDNGPGSLRAALEIEGPRYVIFDISGTIALESPIYVTSPYVTIAGQTAPSPGINIRNYGIYFNTHDVVVQHIRIRYGDTHDKNPGAFAVFAVGGGGHDVVFDHVSVAWAMYIGFIANDYASTGKGHPTRVSLLDSIIAYGLAKNERYTGYGAGFGHQGSTIESSQYTYARNLFVHNSFRQPIIGVGRVQLINDVVYGSGPWTPSDDQWAYQMYWQNQADVGCNRNPKGGSQSVIINTYTIDSNGTGSGVTAGSTPKQKTFSFDFAQDNIDNQDTKIWLYGNRGPHITKPDPAGQRKGIYWVKSRGGADFPNADIWYKAEPAWHSEMHFQTISSLDVPGYVLANAGARPLDRDPVDAIAISHTRAGLIDDLPNMGSRVTSQEEMGGHPKLAVKRRVQKIPDNPHAVAPGQTFRTNIEMWLEEMARDLEPVHDGKAALIKGSPPFGGWGGPMIVNDPVTLVVTPASVPVREPVTVSFKGWANAAAGDWIGLFYKGANDESCISWRYTNSGTLLPGSTAVSEGSYEFSIPPIPGSYEFRFFEIRSFWNNSYIKLATSDPVTVYKPKPAGSAALTVSAETAAPAAEVTVTYSNVPDLDGKEWIGLYKTGEEVGRYFIGYAWVRETNGSCTFTMPTEPGTYEFRLFGDKGYGDKLAISKPVTVR